MDERKQNLKIGDFIDCIANDNAILVGQIMDISTENMFTVRFVGYPPSQNEIVPAINVFPLSRESDIHYLIDQRTSLEMYANNEKPFELHEKYSAVLFYKLEQLWSFDSLHI